ncbi:TetR/AcrR family transcriptional regulator [Streptacidiphilus sp. PB12-B1b]|uniref:TetR/AcrR family transcriptional regulator n=1 Tax=Streptacidiphilus sp. PB12-B1b TaxID=2705012 RepID=UPI001CDC0536|nr:TetR/AcrR family transcriptional regulator [Streptacidiphilus sp. PB12-B1b]
MLEDERVEAILDAAYDCFRIHGVRRTTMEDIARRVGLSRPVVYQYVRNKEDAFHRLAARLLQETLERFRAALAGAGSPTERLVAALGAKVDLTLRVWRESPHAQELLGEGVQLTSDLLEDFHAALRRELVAAVEADLPDADAPEFAELLLALAHGLEVHGADPDVPLRRLRQGVTLLVAGLPGSR